MFTKENWVSPDLHRPSKVYDVPVTVVESNADLEGYGYLVHDPADFTVENKTFEIKKWPVSGWRQLDPETGDEAGTTEGDFQVYWQGDRYYGKNLAVATASNHYLEGVGCRDPRAAVDSNTEVRASASEEESNFGGCIYLWLSDYHPDGGQLFFPKAGTEPCPFFMCLGKAAHGDDIQPEHMRGFKIPAGKGVYIHPSTWHNGIYVAREHSPATMFTRQGRVHARVSANWVTEFDAVCRMRLDV